MKKDLLFVCILFLFFLVHSCKSPNAPEKATPSSVSLTSPNSTIWVGDTEQMTATITMSDGTSKTATGTWSSDYPNVASVSQSGLVTANAPGNATISIQTSEGGLMGYKLLTVQKPVPTSVSLTSSKSEIWVGQTEQMTATVTWSNGATGSAPGTWGSDNTFVASVNQSGLVTGNAAGVATIYFETTEGAIRGYKTLTIKTVWSRSGVGDMVFDMPTSVSRVRVIGTYTGYSSNFIVHVNGSLLVNELLGTGWGQTTYDGTLLTTGGVVEITHSSGVSWSFTEVPSTTALTNSDRKITNFTNQSVIGNREYEIYKRVAAGKK